MARSSSPFRFIFMLILLSALGFGAYIFLNDLDGPGITMSPDTGRISPAQDITLTLTDSKNAIRSVAVLIRRSSGTTTIFERAFTQPASRQTVTFNLKDSGLKDGRFDLEIVARDTAFAGFGRGNSTTLKRDMRLDTQPPRINVRSTTPTVRRGSITAFSYTVSEEVDMTGVQVGGQFYPAFLQQNGLYYCFVPFLLEVAPKQFTPEVVARDMAGNLSRTRLLVHAQDRAYKADKLNISENFLTSKSEDFAGLVPEPLSDLERYIKINQEVRLKDEEVLRSLAARTAPTILWDGAFGRLPGSALRANFGDKRTYMHNGQVIDNQIHMGMDLASTAQAPVPAANHGRVVFADSQGIFGLLVVIDHGLGLMTLYSHMSQILVSVGEEVQKGHIIGNTGVTGLAGGDHLHYGILMHGYQVQPMDWMDKNWIKNAILDRIAVSLS